MSKSTTFLVTAATALALSAPVAHARPASDPVVQGPTPHVATSAAGQDDGFDWGSAAVGAGSAAGLFVLLSAGAVVAIRARVPSPR